MKDLAKPKNIVTNYNFELPTDEEIKKHSEAWLI